ncbi:MAG: tRNA (adenosine(37)-N6)-threonylcarbamoyltransferase complex ATPase subunit type 1 TsaE [bacterium]|nr:tRNA (adenosine(37)-N6)-threonylcarbamoyltransferase complex ATPase subunit type 1 TsaE [bacterium]
MKETIITTSAEETRDLGGKLAQGIAPGTLVCLEGDLGAGKTTFAQGFLEGMGAARPYVSPTYIIMKQHDLPAPTTQGIQRIYHVDAYRVETKDLVHLGFAEWRADKEGIVILEWPERVKELIPKGARRITFASKSETVREIKIEN